MRGLWVGWRGQAALVLAVTAAVALQLALPSASFAVAEKEYSTSFSAECVIAPGSFNFKSSVKVTVSAMGPTEVTPGEEGMFHGAHSTITAPPSLAEDFTIFEANEAKGKATNFVLEGSGAEPGKLNIAKPAEYPEGLPFIAPVEKGKEVTFAIPSLKLHETGLTYSFGPEKVTAKSGVLKAIVSPAAGYVETEKGVYKATGEGLVTSVEGLDNGTHVIGPLTVACTAPHEVIAAEIPIKSTGLEAGHPEFFDNFVELGATHRGVLGWGPIKLGSPMFGAEIECLSSFFGGVWNEGTPQVGHMQILAWNASGNASKTGTELSRECHYKNGTAEVEVWMTDEPALEQTGTVGKRSTPLSVPWNVELRCGEREEAAIPIVKIGTPTGTTPTTGCKSEEEEAAEISAEETARKGCYATTVPAGCVKVDLVEPSLAVEEVYQGSLRPSYRNGTAPLSASRWKYEATTSGDLRLATAFATTLAWVGEIRFTGFATELLQAR